MRAEGFSLVELSIVLVILGLLTGGILTGQNLIRAAELRSVTTEFQTYQTAVMTFRDKYFYLPGDMPNATDFWGAMTSGACPNATGGSGTQTCNGSGDGKITSVGGASQSNEAHLFWQHLANSGIIEGHYTGIAGSGGNQDDELGINTPASRVSNSGWRAGSLNQYTGDTASYALDYGNIFLIGKDTADSGVWDPMMTPEEAWNIDKKIDDGLPARGKVIARHWNNLCAAANDGSHANNDLEANYRLNVTAKNCSLFFIKSF